MRQTAREACALLPATSRPWQAWGDAVLEGASSKSSRRHCEEPLRRSNPAVAVGWGGVYGEMQRATDKEGPGTLFTFAIGGKAPLPELAKYQIGGLLEGVKYDAANVGPGTQLYVSHCGFCHGVPGVDKGGNIKNLVFRQQRHNKPEGHRFQGPVNVTWNARFYGQIV
jgi:mono/diheme cytochrome c family protein